MTISTSTPGHPHARKPLNLPWPVTVRTAVAGDARHLGELQQAGWRMRSRWEPMSDFGSQARPAEYAMRMADGDIIGLAENAEAGGPRILGFITVIPLDIACGPYLHEVGSLYVHEEALRRGIGSRLLHWALTQARHRGLHHLLATSVPANQPACGVFLHCGAKQRHLLGLSTRRAGHKAFVWQLG